MFQVAVYIERLKSLVSLKIPCDLIFQLISGLSLIKNTEII